MTLKTLGILAKRQLFDAQYFRKTKHFFVKGDEEMRDVSSSCACRKKLQNVKG